jgi:hypothetical protein
MDYMRRLFDEDRTVLWPAIYLPAGWIHLAKCLKMAVFVSAHPTHLDQKKKRTH